MRAAAPTRMPRRSQDNETDIPDEPCDVPGCICHGLFRLLFLLLLMLPPVIAVHAQTLTPEPVVLVGQPAPGPLGTTFQSSFNRAVINNAGDIAFYASTSEFNCAGLYRKQGELFDKVTTCPILPGEQVLSESGGLVFTASNGVIYSEFGGLHPVVGSKFSVVKTPVPGGVEGELFSAVGFPVSNDSGMVLFWGTTDITVSQGFWAEINGTLSPYVLVGEPAPGMPSGTAFTNLDDRAVVANDDSVAFKAATTASSQTGVWVAYPDGSGRKVIAPGDPAPGSSGNWFHAHSLNTDLSSNPAINASGEVAFRGTTTNANENGIWAERWDEATQQYSLHNVILAADAVALPSGEIWRPSKFGWVSINNRGELAYIGCSRQSILDVCGVMKSVWNDATESYEHHLVVLDARIAGAEPEPGGLGLFIGGGHGVALNNLGQVAFRALAATPESSNGVWGLWGWDQGTGLHRVYLAGDSIEVAPDDIRTVTNFVSFSPFLSRASGNDDGRPSAFNDQGQVVFRLAFEEAYPRGEGLFLATLPQHRIDVLESPSGIPNPVPSAEEVNLSIRVEDNAGHALSFNWEANCSAWSSDNGRFDDAGTEAPVWTAPDNLTGLPKECVIAVTIRDSEGLETRLNYVQVVLGHVKQAGQLDVSPETGIDFTGPVGGPFTRSVCDPANELLCPQIAQQTYQLANPGDAGILYSVSQASVRNSPHWIDIEPSEDGGLSSTGTLLAGTSMAIEVSLNSEANSLCKGLYSEPVAFSNLSNGNGDTERIINLRVDPAETIAPVVVAPDDIVKNATALFTPVDLGSASATDNRDGPLQAEPNNRGPFPVGVTEVTWQAVDCSGNAGTDTQLVTITDSPPQVTAPPNISLEVQREIYTAEQLDPLGKAVAEDNIGIVSGPAPALNMPLRVGSYQVNWVAFDTSGQRGVDQQWVTVTKDMTPPVISAPERTIRVASSPIELSAAALGVSVTDNYDPDPSLTPSVQTLETGINFITWTAEDSSGNKIARPQKVNVTLIVKLMGVEVIQVSQNLDNDVILIEDKTTRLRAYFEPFTDTASATVKPLLKAYREGFSLGPGAIAASNIAPVQAIPDVIDFRNTARTGDVPSLDNAAAFYDLPANWTRGTTTFEVQAPFHDFDCSHAVGSVEPDCTVTVNFQKEAAFKAVLLKVDYGVASAVPTDAMMQDEELRVLATYPVAAPDISNSRTVHISDSSFTGVEPDLDTVNSAVDDIRENDCGTFSFLNICDETLYHGVVHPNWGKEEEGGGLANWRWASSGRTLSGTTSDGARGTFRTAHELGHNLQRPHTEDEDGNTVCGEVAADLYIAFIDPFPWIFDMDSDNNPSTPKVRRATLGPVVGSGEPISSVIVGWDSIGHSQVYLGIAKGAPRMRPAEETWELMSYCGIGARWPSEYTYELIHRQLREDFGTKSSVSTTSSRSISLKTAVYEAKLEPDEIIPRLLVSGVINNETGELTVGPLWQPEYPLAENYMLPGDYRLQVLAKSRYVLEEIPFVPIPASDIVAGKASSATFRIPVQQDPDMNEIRILKNDQVLFSRKASHHIPSVKVLYPNGGEVFTDDRVTLQWEGVDKDRDAQLSYTVLFSGDGGTRWQTLAMHYQGTTLSVNLNELGSSDSAMIKVKVSDGFNVASDVSDGVFHTPNSPPVVRVLWPDPYRVFKDGQLIVFKALSKDVEDGRLSDANLRWVSDIDGDIGTGHNFHILAQDLTPGLHRVTLYGQDSDGAEDFDTVSFEVFENEVMPVVLSHVTVTPSVIWPPNHEMIPVNVSTFVHTTATQAPDCSIVSITANEGDDELGDGMTTGDIEITGPLTARVRAERSGLGSGREYQIAVQCSVTLDGVPYISDRVSVTVSVPGSDPANLE